jgi:hypothetical protein
MALKRILSFILITLSIKAYGQQKEDDNYEAGFQSLSLVDSTRNYKPDTPKSDSLYFRPVELDIWYPSTINGNKRLLFKDLFSLLEQRATKNQGGKNFAGMTAELAQIFAIELGLEIHDASKLLDIWQALMEWDSRITGF